MADNIYRSIYSTLPEDPDFIQLSKEAKLVFYTLKTWRYNNMANIFYFGEGELTALSKWTKIPAQKITKTIFKELQDTHWIRYQYPIVWVSNGLKYEPNISLNNPKHTKGVQNVLKSLPKLEIVLTFCDYYNLAYPFDRVSIPIRYTDTETVTETDTETKLKKGETSFSPSATSIDKNQEFQKAWDSLNKADYKCLDLAGIFIKMKNWVANNPAKKNYTRFIINWLNSDLEKFRQPRAPIEQSRPLTEDEKFLQAYKQGKDKREEIANPDIKNLISKIGKPVSAGKEEW